MFCVLCFFLFTDFRRRMWSYPLSKCKKWGLERYIQFTRLVVGGTWNWAPVPARAVFFNVWIWEEVLHRRTQKGPITTKTKSKRRMLDHVDRPILYRAILSSRNVQPIWFVQLRMQASLKWLLYWFWVSLPALSLSLSSIFLSLFSLFFWILCCPKEVLNIWFGVETLFLDSVCKAYVWTEIIFLYERNKYLIKNGNKGFQKKD